MTMLANPTLTATRARVTRAEQAFFVKKLVLCGALTAAGAVAALTPVLWIRICGYVVLAAMFVHAVELQHQVLHYSAFVNRPAHRPVGVLLGLPMMVIYSHYQVRHIHHHKYLGTDRDVEFFQFDTRGRISPGRLLLYIFNYRRWFTTLRDAALASTGRWRFDGQISPRAHRNIEGEYRLLLAIVLGAAAVSVATGSTVLIHLWLIPLLLAEPIHFLVELPEHVFCDQDTQDVLVNTRTITGHGFSTWFTNANNLHVEHHLYMTLPMERLTSLHEVIAPLVVNQCRTYPQFYAMAFKRFVLGR
ncbi:MAG TPA: fatty acid desaturase [Candidatus Limnocylindrales bacterium]|nr:fatty acid desaturase [Candidatus Limnocylindrales bacterium]